MTELLVPVDHIHPNPNNPRFEVGDVTELASSIEEYGLLNPILVMHDPFRGEGHYLLKAGERRWTAAKYVIEEVPCRLYTPPEGISDLADTLLVGLIENEHGKGLNPMERALAYGRLRDECDMTAEAIGKKQGLTGSTIGHYLTLLELNKPTQQRVRDGRLSVDEAVRIVRGHRARTRKEQGKKPIDPGWEPDHFTKDHHLARVAKAMCDARQHSGRRRLGNVACGQCWETAIRQDQEKVTRVEYQDAGINVPFLPPIMTPGTRRENGSNQTLESEEA
jgi:ParB/RepB/Spo0J family partition protein